MRKVESLGLYLVPEQTPLDRQQNTHARQVAEKIKAERMLALQNHGVCQWDKVKRSCIRTDFHSPDRGIKHWAQYRQVDAERKDYQAYNFLYGKTFYGYTVIGGRWRPLYYRQVARTHQHKLYSGLCRCGDGNED